MTKADLTAQVAANTDMTKKDADKAVKGHHLGLWHL